MFGETVPGIEGEIFSVVCLTKRIEILTGQGEPAKLYGWLSFLGIPAFEWL
jgi:hypothetical protein